ncbi:helix-turn-helix transcriptional regulator [Roseomonas eburnea]|uniref:Helix-turn-helix transcriptional regulator n=1 Tax=Neoroseomonas eburnea TaxID=1346889 RepID=A0A9X9XK02_9PROT|nr:helix-turn-helix domain-containing protein [Neoroseomonas eburnea]MBR0684038.1 helix-turn-helix transcriptional regulator [Neoroseomonas eburnea]
MAQATLYGQFCPVSIASEVLTQRWTPLVIRELHCGSVRFSDLQRGVPRMSSSLLARRLKELEYAGIVERREAAAGSFEYHLTPAGREIFPLVEQMGLWAQRWLRHRLVETPNLDPDLLMWDIRRNIVRDRLPGDRRFVVEFLLSGAPITHRRYWLVFDRGEVDLCYRDPGHEIALFVTAALRVLTQVWLGHLGIAQAVREDQLRLEGAKPHVAAFPSWFGLSGFAPAGRLPPGRLELATPA